jgi:hypothetical protein
VYGGRHLRTVVGRADFRRLFATRLAAQFGDGVFQASLAGAMLFNPERQASAADVAAGFAVILLPYSFVGPFAGVLLDRWWRQRVLVRANLVRAVAVLGVAFEVAAGVHGEPFYVSALVVISINRFFLSALSASVPHVVDRAELITANALSSTTGGLVTSLGGALAIGIRVGVGDTNVAYAVVAALAALPYLTSALAAHGFPTRALGPDDVARQHHQTVRSVTAGLVAGARHVAELRPVVYALGAVATFRFCYGMTVISVLLLYRNYFQDDGFFRAGLAGLGQIVVGLAVGTLLAALVTPAIARRLGFVRWPAILFGAAAGIQIGLGLSYRMPLLVMAAFGLGFASQGIKICVDTLVQQSVEDEYRGRVFTLYDTLFNITFVAAAVATAILLPDNGYAPASVFIIGCVYVITGLAYLHFAGRCQRGAYAVPLPAPSIP